MEIAVRAKERDQSVRKSTGRIDFVPKPQLRTAQTLSRFPRLSPLIFGSPKLQTVLLDLVSNIPVARIEPIHIGIVYQLGQIKIIKSFTVAEQWGVIIVVERVRCSK